MALVNRPFNPTGKTVLVAGDTTAPAGVRALSIGAPPAEQYRLQNNGTVTVFVAFGDTANAAQINAVIPTGTSRNSFPLPAGAIEIISGPTDCYWSGITASSTASVFVTPGIGY